MQRVSQVQPILRAYYYTQFLQLQDAREQIQMQVTKLTEAVRNESPNISKISRKLRDMEVTFSHRQKRLDDEIEQSIRDQQDRIQSSCPIAGQIELAEQEDYKRQNVMAQFIREANKLSLHANMFGVASKPAR